MLTTNDAVRVFDTILSIPGMNEAVRIDLKISRKNVLLLHHVIARGTTQGSEANPSVLLGSLPAEDLQELKRFGEECLQKAGLTQLSEKLQTLGENKKQP